MIAFSYCYVSCILLNLSSGLKSTNIDLSEDISPETKGPVGSAINKAQGGKGDLWEQGKEIAKKTRWQKRYWSNKTKTDQLPLIRPDAYLPKSVDNILGLHDLYDVPTEEKSIMNNAIINYSRNDTNTIILNNETNI